MKENLGILSEKDKDWLIEDANKYFSQISPDLSNGDLLIKTVDGEGASSFIVQRLENVESEDDSFWNDNTLLKWFEDQADLGSFTIPKDPVEKLRWQALVCIAASKKEGFSYGNVVFPPDYLPEESEEFWDYIKNYGQYVLENIVDLRKHLRS